MTFRLFQTRQKYTSAEQSIIDFLNKTSEIENLTISDLAQKSMTSNATIIRLCHKVGCSGFPELKIELVKERAEKKFTSKKVDFSFPFMPADSLDEIAKAITDLYSNGLKQLYSSIDMEKVERIAQFVLHADRIFVYGIGDSGLTAQSFINKVNKLNIYPIFASGHDEAESNSHQFRKNDVALLITYRGKGHGYEQIVDNLRQNEGKIVIITANSGSIVTKKCDLALIIPNEEKEQKVSTFYSQFAFQYVLNLLFSVLYRELILK